MSPRIWRRSPDGTEYEVNVPRIKPGTIQSVVFLYDNADSASANDDNGGTGFLVSQPHDDQSFVYAVTAAHNVSGRDGEYSYPVISVLGKGRQWRTLDLVGSDWRQHPDNDDVAIAYLGVATELDWFSGHSIGRDRFIERSFFDETEENGRLGPGDDAFYVGRFIAHDGRSMRTPAVRFGHVAMLPHEPIPHQTRGDVESFLVEGRSLPGYSGAPVFAIPLPYGASLGIAPSILAAHLLGVDWGHIHDRATVVDGAGRTTDYSVPEHSGFMGVTPAWKIADLLDHPTEVAMRDEKAKTKRKTKRSTTIDSSTGNEEFQNFENLARELVNTPKSEIDERRGGSERQDATE